MNNWELKLLYDTHKKHVNAGSAEQADLSALGAMEKCEALSTKPEECRYSFFQHTACEFFPCHETAHPEDFNCLFCYCPLYALGDRQKYLIMKKMK